MVSQTAGERAESLLLQHLTPEQQDTYKRRGYFDFVGSQGAPFRLATASALLRAGLSSTHPLIEMSPYSDSRPTLRICRNIFVRTGHGYDLVPEADNLLALKCILEAKQSLKEEGCTAACYLSAVKSLEGE